MPIDQAKNPGVVHTMTVIATGTDPLYTSADGGADATVTAGDATPVSFTKSLLIMTAEGKVEAEAKKAEQDKQAQALGQAEAHGFSPSQTQSQSGTHKK